MAEDFTFFYFVVEIWVAEELSPSILPNFNQFTATPDVSFGFCVPKKGFEEGRDVYLRLSQIWVAFLIKEVVLMVKLRKKEG